MTLTRLHVLGSGGVANLTLTVQPDGTKLVLRELRRRFIFNYHVHRGFVRGTKIRELLTPHPNIVYSAEVGYTGLAPYEVIEYVPGKNLQERILNKDETVRDNPLLVLRQAANAIAYVHGKGIAHLDIKAENFLVDTTKDGLKLKLTDFDLSRDQRSHHDRRRSGTASHMAPEQLKGGQIGFESDIFAFGVMAYYLVTGRKPFSGYTLEEARRQQVSEGFKIRDPLRLNPDITPKLGWIILRCLERDPAKRFPGMAYLCQELDAI